MLAFVLFAAALAVECSDKCYDPSKPSILICASRLHRTMPINVGSSCLFHCNVTALSVGACGCPNGCPNGSCSGGKCVCNAGFAGADCSLLDCSVNACAHGSCEVGKDGFGLCVCDEGFTGPLCAVAVASNLQPPNLSSLFPDERVWHDIYGDDHPLFNMTAVTTVRLQVAPHDYEYLVAPSNDHNASKVPCVALISNQALSVYQPMFLSLKGASSRECVKKSFKLHGRLVDQKVISLKSACEDATMLRNVVAMDYARAMGLPFQRVSFAQLWINDEFRGFFLLEEEIEKEWVKAHTGKIDDDVLLKNHRAQLVPKANYSDNYEVKLGNETAAYALLEALVAAVNNQFDRVASLFKTDRFLRYMVVEWHVGNPDSYSWRGNNWWLLFKSEKGSSVQVGSYVPYDQEESFGLGMYLTPAQWENMTADTFFNCQTITPPIDCGSPHKLSQNLLSQNRSQFDALTQLFVSKVWLPSIQKLKQYGAVMELLLEGDQWYTLDFDAPMRNETTFATLDLPILLDYIQQRAKHSSK
jgi:hypothetical protein